MTPIILTAFGTTSSARNSYEKIEAALRQKLPSHPIHWSYSSRMVTAQLKKEQQISIKTVPQLLEEFMNEGHEKVIVQSLHLFPGYEFHKLCRDVSSSPMRCGIGQPLLTMPCDYQQLSTLLQPIISQQQNPDTAILIMGHGTDHPTWTAYSALQQHLRTDFNESIFVGVVEKFPNCDHLIDNILEQGYKRVFMIPLFLVAGLHYNRDMMGKENSWKTRLRKHNISVDSFPHGIGMLSGIEDIIYNHLQIAAGKIDISL